MSAQYDASVFTEIETIGDAQRIILTPEEGMTTKHRWETETPKLMELMQPWIRLRSTVLDYGCGIGRLSKPILNMCGARAVVGVDISANMRALAASLVDRDEFMAIHPKMLGMIPDHTFDFAVAVWVLQHCSDPSYDIELVYNKLKVHGILFVLNNVRRAVPVRGGQWVDDGVDIDVALQQMGFKRTTDKHHLDDPLIAPGWMRENTFWAMYEK